MTVQLLLNNITCVSFYLLALVSFFNPAKLNITANKWFGLCMFSAGCMLLNAIIYEAGAEAQYADVILFNELSRFIIAPALYLSIVHFTSPYKEFKNREYLHFIPSALFLIFMAATAAGYQLFTLLHIPGRIPAIIISLFGKGQLLVYWVLAWYTLTRHKRNIQLINSTTEGVDLSWLQYMLLGIAVMLAAWFASILLQQAHWIQLIISAGYLTGVLSTGYFLLAQKEVYPFDQPELQNIAEVISQPAKQGKQRLSQAQSIELQSRLTDLMATQKTYLDNELSLPVLAKELNVSTHDLSYLLNEVLGTSFFKFINNYRVEEAKQLMLSAQHQHLNLLGIAYAAGFNSKTTFNTAFKNETGLSPSQFINQNKRVISTASA